MSTFNTPRFTTSNAWKDDERRNLARLIASAESDVEAATREFERWMYEAFSASGSAFSDGSAERSKAATASRYLTEAKQRLAHLNARLAFLDMSTEDMAKAVNI